MRMLIVLAITIFYSSLLLLIFWLSTKPWKKLKVGSFYYSGDKPGEFSPGSITKVKLLKIGKKEVEYEWNSGSVSYTSIWFFRMYWKELK